MRIGMILDKTFPPDPRIENEALTLINMGHEVFLYCFDYSGKQATSEIINQIKVHRVKIPKIMYSISALAYTIPLYHNYLQKSIGKFLKQHKIESIHIHDMQIARSIYNINKRLKLPVVLDLHENKPEIMKYYSHVTSMKGKLLIFPSIWKKFEYKYIKWAKRVIVVTEEAKQYYIDELGEKAEKFYVVPNAVRKEFYTTFTIDKAIQSKYKNDFMILYVGDTGIRRGLQTVIKATQNLKNIIPNLKVVFVGNSISDHILRQEIKQLNLEKYIELTGWQDFTLFPTYIDICKIGICPIHKNIHHETTFANKLFQYLSFGKPIVVSDCLSQKNLVEHYQCGLSFEDRNDEDFATQVLKLYNDQKLYKEMSAKARAAVENHLQWEKSSINLKSLYSLK